MGFLFLNIPYAEMIEQATKLALTDRLEDRICRNGSWAACGVMLVSLCMPAAAKDAPGGDFGESDSLHWSLDSTVQPVGRVKIKVSYRLIEQPWSNPFVDLDGGGWYYEAVRFVQERVLMNTARQRAFRPRRHPLPDPDDANSV